MDGGGGEGGRGRGEGVGTVAGNRGVVLWHFQRTVTSGICRVSLMLSVSERWSPVVCLVAVVVVVVYLSSGSPLWSFSQQHSGSYGLLSIFPRIVCD
jgi:hypothetical protein